MLSASEMNAVRYQRDRGHVESWFLRANDPDSRRALWLKVTVLAPTDGPAVAEAWCCTFGPEGRWGQRITRPVDQAELGPTLRVGDCTLNPDGGATGQIGDRSWDMAWRPGPSSLAAPLCLMPSERMIEWPFPKSKLLTPFPVLLFSGAMQIGDQSIDLDGWTGMQGHNWDNEHAHTYAWGQCVFLDLQGKASCMVEGFSGRIRLAGRTTPFFSGLAVRRAGRTYRFTRLLDLWNQKPHLDAWTRWRLHISGPAGQAELFMESRPEETVCLGYENPAGHISYCLNSKLARTYLRVNPVDEDAFMCHSKHGGALEFLRRDPDPRFDSVV
jgi:hypothetical protein